MTRSASGLAIAERDVVPGAVLKAITRNRFDHAVDPRDHRRVANDGQDLARHLAHDLIGIAVSEHAGERTPAGLVGPCDEAPLEGAVEGEQLAAAAWPRARSRAFRLGRAASR